MKDDNKKLTDLNLIPVDEELDLEHIKKLEAAQPEADFTFKLGSRRDERYLAFYFLYALDRADYTITLSEAVEAFEKGFESSVPHGCFAITLARRALENRSDLDSYLVPFLKNWPLERLGCCTRLILRLAVSELKQPDAIGSIIINEAIELAKSFAEKDAYRFINGILDEVAKSLRPEVEDKGDA